MERFDVAVVGAGIAGASAAFEIAADRRVVLFERETTAGYHTTGRSAAQFVETYGNEPVRRLTRASRAFLASPPSGFTDTPILHPMGAMFIGTAEQSPSLEAHFSAVAALTPNVAWLTADEAVDRVPILRVDRLKAAVLEPDAMGIDVHALHGGYLRGFRKRGGVLRLDGDAAGLERTPTGWIVHTRNGRVQAHVVVNAAGAWADHVAKAAGVPPIGLRPLRRTAIVFSPPRAIDPVRWPLVLDADERFYFRPEGSRILASPADETPSEPCDAQPEELDVAITVDRIQRATTLSIGHIENRWAGLRSFVDDRTPVCGFDPTVPGFFWLAGQGGYGIQTAPALARTAAALTAYAPLPEDIGAQGLAHGDLAPSRLRS